MGSSSYPRWGTTILGALLGFLVLHPLVMLLPLVMASGGELSAKDIVGEMLMAFSTVMLPWSLAFATFNGVIGFYYGKNKQAEKEKETLIEDLQNALDEVKTLSGLLPMCATCKGIRDDSGYWNRLEEYLEKHSDAQFTHGICPACLEEQYPDIYKKMKERREQEKVA